MAQNRRNNRFFHFKPFSKKQRKVLNWWTENSPVNDYDGIIADGAIRSGKSICMSLSFAIWAMESYDGQNFGMAGKTIGSFRRNVLVWLILMLRSRGYECDYARSDNLLTVSRGATENYFYVFGGKDERSQDLIQGITLAGMYFDEVALMPESFVNQATGRCSVEGAKLWFNCNPESPSHWFKLEWIDKKDEKNLLHLHFTMDDNLSLSAKVKKRYIAMYSGVFFERFILGLWAMAEGLIYQMWQEAVGEPPEGAPDEYALSIDYGTRNAFAALLWAKYGTIWYAIDEYYYSGKKTGVNKTDDDYANDLETFIPDTGRKIKTYIDPTATSMITLLRKKGRYRVISADNAVVPGIEETAVCMQRGIIKFSGKCRNWKREVQGYVWDEDVGEDKPVKDEDHCMDAARYFVHTKKLASIKQKYKPVYTR